MITVNTTVGAQVHGLRINDTLENDLLPNQSETQKAVAVPNTLKNIMAILLADRKNWSLDDAIEYVRVNTTEIT